MKGFLNMFCVFKAKFSVKYSHHMISVWKAMLVLFSFLEMKLLDSHLMLNMELMYSMVILLLFLTAGSIIMFNLGAQDMRIINMPSAMMMTPMILFISSSM